MKKIIFITVIIIFIPFLIVNFYKIDEKEEIKIKYMSNTIIRVKRMSTGNIDSIPFEEYIVGVLAGEMPIYFDKEAFKAQAVAARSYAFKRMEYNKDNDYDVVDSVLKKKKELEKKNLINISKTYTDEQIINLYERMKQKELSSYEKDIDFMNGSVSG